MNVEMNVEMNFSWDNVSRIFVMYDFYVQFRHLTQKLSILGKFIENSKFLNSFFMLYLKKITLLENRFNLKFT